MKKGYVQIYTGNGKGKTTAAIGLAVRAAGAGMRVWFGQFVKGQSCSEHVALARFDELITLQRFGSESFITATPGEEDRRHVREGFALARAALYEGPYQVVILDEICVAASLGLVEVGEILELINRKPPATELVLTGRNAPEPLIQKADLVTEMKEIRHYYAQGVAAREGIEC